MPSPMPKPERAVHNRLEVLRAERGLSRRQLADTLDINYQTIGYIERGDYNPSLELALRIANLFRLPVEAIFALTPMTPLSDKLFREPPTGMG
jgi:putative transcriptional regulator